MTSNETTLIGASVLGRDHLAFHKNNQDSFATRLTAMGGVGVVSDGCGSRPRSEVGAHLTTAFLVDEIARLLRDEVPVQDIPRTAVDNLVMFLSQVARNAVEPGSVRGDGSYEISTRSLDFVQSHLLATLVGVCWRGEDGVVFQVGDGLFLCGTELVNSDQNNTPTYLGYHIPAQSQPEIALHPFKCSEVGRVVIATDGLAPELLGQVLEPKGEVALKMKLNVLQKQGFLLDDTTVVVAKWGA